MAGLCHAPTSIARFTAAAWCCNSVPMRMTFLTRTQHMGAAALLIGVSVFLSRFMGLIRDKVISYYFGAGPEADIYFVSFVVPDFINYLLAGGYFSITLIPLLARRFGESEDSGWNFFSAVFWWVVIASSACTLLAWFFAPELARIAAPGFTAEMTARLTFFLRIILPAQIFFLPGATLTALLYWRRQFTAPALMPLIYNGCIILGGLAMRYLAPGKGMEGFCWGVVAGAALGAFVLPLFTARAGGLHITASMLDPYLKRFILLALPLMLGQSIVALDEQFIRIFGSLAGEGSVSLLAYARRIMLVPVGIVAQAAGVASYPFLASLAAAKDMDRFAATVNNAAKSALSLVAPLCVWMAAASLPLMRLLFEQGRFTAPETEASAVLVVVMLAAVAFWTVHQLVGRAFYAFEDTLTPAVVGTLTTAASLPIYWGLTKTMGAYGVALAGVTAVIAYTLALAGVWVRRRGPDALAGTPLHLSKALLTAALPGFIAFAAARGIPSYTPGHPLAGAALALAGSGLIFAALYLPAARLFYPALLDPLRPILQKIASRLRR